MFINNLHIIQFKNIENIQLQFSKKITFIIGKNGSGKTSILDAIHTLLCGKSHFNNLEKYQIQYNKDFYKIKCKLQDANKQNNIQCLMQIQQRKKIWLNEILYEKLSLHIGKFPCVIIAPEDINLVNEGSEMRRSFIDFSISQHDIDYLNKLIEYNLIIKQRNALLKLNPNTSPDTTLINTYNTILSNLANSIFEKRKMFFDFLNPLFNKYYSFISNEHESVILNFQSQLLTNNLLDLLEANIQKDIITQRTNFGIHKDDFSMQIFDNDARKTASQGQKKSILIALKLAQYYYIKQQTGKKPILMLDDIFEKIDETRAAKLFELISNDDFEQILVSDSYEMRYNNGFLIDDCQTIKIENGLLT